MTQLTLTFQDQKRLGRQLKAVRDLMEDGRWRTLDEIGRVVTGTQTALSARLRDLRKLGLQVEARRVRPGSGLYQYQVHS